MGDCCKLFFTNKSLIWDDSIERFMYKKINHSKPVIRMRFTGERPGRQENSWAPGQKET